MTKFKKLEECIIQESKASRDKSNNIQFVKRETKWNQLSLKSKTKSD